MKLGHFIEYESKYHATLEQLFPFKRIAETLTGKPANYVIGPDSYYIKPGTDNFKRFRKGLLGDKRKEITTKVKTGTHNNIHRIEKNLRVDGNSDEVITSMIEDDGYEFNFKITKYCFIYEAEDAILVFYSVRDDTSGKEDLEHFIEFEVKEELIPELTEEQAKNIIKKYEEAFSTIGINSNKRLKLSLYERYKK
jgi:hypothetical protein